MRHRCTTCQELKEAAAFSPSFRHKSSKVCRECKAEYNLRWYEANKAKHVADVKRNTSRYRARGSALLLLLKRRPCVDCGGSFHPFAMDFDHVRGEKLGDVSTMRALSVERLMAEVDKCDLVCANCHRLRELARGDRDRMTPTGLEPVERLSPSQFRKLVPYPLGDGAETSELITSEGGHLCSGCGLRKSAAGFTPSMLRKSDRSRICRECRRAYDRLRTARTREERAQRKRALVARVVEQMGRLKERPCADCGKNFPSSVMDFDHARGEKRGTISKLRLHSPEKLAAELAKCDLVCAVCHRLRTGRRMEEAGQRVYWLTAGSTRPDLVEGE